MHFSLNKAFERLVTMSRGINDSSHHHESSWLTWNQMRKVTTTVGNFGKLPRLSQQNIHCSNCYSLHTKLKRNNLWHISYATLWKRPIWPGFLNIGSFEPTKFSWLSLLKPKECAMLWSFLNLLWSIPTTTWERSAANGDVYQIWN